ncbi:MAG: PKD domain-containing protein [Bacteroidota bacterium]|nr:PKD domain-containing protein [Bacteroidota bacterium]
MRKLFFSLIFSFFFVNGWIWAQPISMSVSNDTTICMGTSALLELTFDTTLYETTSYNIIQIPHNPLPVTIGQSVTTNLIDDTYWGPFPIGFDFCFFGQVYNQFWVGANGWISFQALSSATYDPWVTQAIPNTDPSRPRACVMAPYRDWHPGQAGDIRWASVGPPGNKKLIVNWVDVALFSCTSVHGTFQVVLHQTSNYVDNHLLNVPTCPGWNSGNGVQGIQNAAGTIAYSVTGRNNTLWTANMESWRYLPNGPPQLQNFQWTGNGNPVGTGTTVLVSPSVLTEYVATYEPCGGFFSDTVYVTPQVCGFLTQTSTDAICFGEASGTATITIHDAMGPYDYSWSNGINTISTSIGSNDSINSVSNLITGYYSVTVTTYPAGPTGPAYELIDSTFVIGQPPPVTLNLSSTPETCPGASDGTITAVTSNAFAPYIFSCQGQPNSAPTALETYTFENLPTGNYTITITDNNGCDATAQIEVEELSITFTTTQTEIKCYGDTNAMAQIFVIGGTAPFTYQWTPIGGNTPGITNLGAGTYYVTATDDNGCQVNTSITFTEPPPVSIYTSADKTICYSHEANITSAAIGGTTPYAFHWIPGGYTSQNITVDPVESTQYCVYVTDTFNCRSTTKCITIFVNPPLEIEAFTYDDTICQGDTTTIFSEISGGNGGPYIYELFNGPVVTPPFEVSPESTTKYIVVGQDNCNTPLVKDTVQITVLPAPLINITSSVIKGCAPLKVQFFENSPDIGQSYFWNFNDSETFNYSVQKNPVHVFYNPGIYEIDLMVTSPWECQSKAQHHEDIVVFPRPISLFYVDPIITSIMDPVISFVNNSDGAFVSYWAFGDGDSIIVENPYPHSFPAVPGKYTISLITETIDGCRDTSYQVITIEEQEDIFYIPNAFNPYSIISENQTFRPYVSLLDKDHYNMYIYNRWGELIFESSDIEIGWDGRSDSGEVVSLGTYTYLIKFRDIKGKDYRKTGSVTVVH